jgi:signal transduction histidine kinase
LIALPAERLRRNDRRLPVQRLAVERRRGAAESRRRPGDAAPRAAEELALKAEELAATVDEKERIQQALIRSNQELAAADRRKDEFLAVLGHELRNPLAPLVAGLEILKRGIGEGAERGKEASAELDRMQRTRDAMDRQVRYLARLVDDLLDVSRINSGKIELRRGPVNLQEVLEQAVAAVRPALDERRHRLQTKLPPQPLLIVADGVRVTQVVANLLSNAVRYTDEGGRIVLRCQKTDDQVIIEVEDNGRGIPSDLLPHIFGMFVQEQAGGGGLGLGLTLVERLVSLHGGRVSARSPGPGKGATFRVELPFLDPATTALSAEMPALNGVSTHPPEAPRANRPLAIALIDDNPDIRETMFDLLTTWGHNVETAADGPSGVELILRTKPDLAFVDIGLPRLDGYGVAAQVRERLGDKRMRLVAMSGYGQEADRRRSLEVGFNAHLVKPADIDAILNVLSPLHDR